MNEDLQEMLLFCKKYDSVYLYGATMIGKHVKKFLERNNVGVELFLVSDAVGNPHNLDGIPVVLLKSMDHIDAKVGIVLSLSEKFQKDVCDALSTVCRRTDGIFKVSSKLFDDIMIDNYRTEAHRTLLYDSIEFSLEEQKIYVARIRNFQSMFHHVIVRMIDFRYFGCVGACWQRYRHQNEKVGNPLIYEVYYPITENNTLQVPNKALMHMIETNTMGVIRGDTLRFWQYFIRHFPSFFTIDQVILLCGWKSNQENYPIELDYNKSLVAFSDEEVSYGKMKLEEIGIREPYICISSRDSAFYENDSANGFQFTNQRMNDWRNSSIESYRLAIKKLWKENIQCVRMGSAVDSSMDEYGLIDFASKHYEELLDIYITSKCRFFVSSLSGIVTLPILTGKPMVIVNSGFLSVRNDAPPYFSKERDLGILKKFWDKKRKKYLSLKEILTFETSNLSRQYTNDVIYLYERNEVIPVENTEEEIWFVIKEMKERLDGTMQYSEEDDELQSRYEDIVQGFDLKDNMLLQWKIGAHFLRNNQYLLG